MRGGGINNQVAQLTRLSPMGLLIVAYHVYYTSVRYKWIKVIRKVTTSMHEPMWVCIKGVVNCQNSRDKGPPEGNSARG